MVLRLMNIPWRFMANSGPYSTMSAVDALSKLKRPSAQSILDIFFQYCLCRSIEVVLMRGGPRC